jgi:hypothetical protein
VAIKHKFKKKIITLSIRLEMEAFNYKQNGCHTKYERAATKQLLFYKGVWLFESH